MRAPARRGDGDEPGTGGDGGATMPTNRDAATTAPALSPMRRPQASPVCPQPSEGRRANEINVSPMSLLVPAIASKTANSDDFAREAFEERAAIMEFDGGLTRADAEAAALALLGAAR